MNTRLVTLLVALPCFAALTCIVKADQKPLLPAATPQVFSEKDVLGDWQTQGEGWRIKLNAHHSAAVYFEGAVESQPQFTTWKLVGSHVVIDNATLFKAEGFEELGSDFIVLPSQGHLVMLPKNELPVAEKRGFAACSCLWHTAQKRKQ